MKLTTQRIPGSQTSCLRPFVAILGLVVAQAIVSAQESKPGGEAANSAKASVPADPPEPSVPAKLPQQRDANSIPEIVGTWSRSESATSSKLTIWPVENREFLFFIESADGNGLLEWKPGSTDFAGPFTFNLLDDSGGPAILRKGPNGTMNLVISLRDGLRKQLLRGGFAKTERELDKKLSTELTRVEVPVEQKPMPTVAVLKTQYDPLRIRELLRAKYREQPYRFFSTRFQLISVTVLAPAEAQEEIEFLIHKLDVKDEPNGQAASPNIAQAAPANQPQAPHPVPRSDEPPPAFSPDRFFEVRRSADQTLARIERHTLPCVLVLPGSSAIGFVKAGDLVDLLLPDNEKFVVLNSDDKYVTPMRVVAKGLPVEKLVDHTGDLRLTLRATDAEYQRLENQTSESDVQAITITHVVRLTHVAAEDIVPLIREAFPFGEPKSGQVPLVSCEAGLKQNAVVLKGNVTWSWQPLALLDVEAAIQKLDVPSQATLSQVHPVNALPDTPAAKQLVEQLVAQESAAAAEAATIRQLQANGQAEQNRQPLAEHQRKLKNLLSTAFDLKLQLEELQVKELQSRLSRLERQIGQRKELREKIINRRAGELIEGDSLRWDSTGTAPSKLPGSAVGNIKKSAKTATPEAVAILRERLGPLWDDLRSGKAKPDAVLRAMNELAQAEPPEAHAQHVELLQGLLELVRVLQSADAVSKAEVLEIEAPYEKARSLNNGASSKTSPLEPPRYVAVKPEADDIVVDLYGGSGALLDFRQDPANSKLIKLTQSLNALKGVTTNFREAGKGAVIVMAIVRDPSQRCQREARQTGKESELRIAINSALKAAGIEATQWEGNSGADETTADEPVTSKTSHGQE